MYFTRIWRFDIRKRKVYCKIQGGAINHRLLVPACCRPAANTNWVWGAVTGKTNGQQPKQWHKWGLGVGGPSAAVDIAYQQSITQSSVWDSTIWRPQQKKNYGFNVNNGQMTAWTWHKGKKVERRDANRIRAGLMDWGCQKMEPVNGYADIELFRQHGLPWVQRIHPYGKYIFLWI